MWVEPRSYFSKQRGENRYDFSPLDLLNYRYQNYDKQPL